MRRLSRLAEAAGGTARTDRTVFGARRVVADIAALGENQVLCDAGRDRGCGDLQDGPGFAACVE
jgi:hypothetical protein